MINSLKSCRGSVVAALLTFCSASLIPALTYADGAACVALPDERIGVQLYTLNKLFYPELYASPEARKAAMEQFMAARKAAEEAAAAGKPVDIVAPARPPADPEVVDSVLGQVAAIGYRNVEMFRDYGMDHADLRALLDKHGLRAVAGHGSLDPADFDKTLAFAEAIGQKMVGSSGFGTPGIDKGLDAVLETARNLNAMGEKASAKGIKLYVHNHAGEFETQYLYDINDDDNPVSTTAWEIIAAETDPRYVHFELDVYWAYRAFEKMGLGEAEMLDFIRKHADRIILYHVKEAAQDEGQTELGHGVLNWPAIYEAGSNVEYFISEYDGPSNPMESIEIAYDYMRCMD